MALIGLDTPSHLIAALGWMVGGLVHIALPEFLVRSYPPAAQKLLRNSDLARLGARAFGALTIFLGIVVLLSLD